jgi:hypothetical protein
MKLFFIFLLLLLYKDCFFPEESQHRCDRKVRPGTIVVVHYLNPVFLRAKAVFAFNEAMKPSPVFSEQPAVFDFFLLYTV